jgi:hypothetical protein
MKRCTCTVQEPFKLQTIAPTTLRRRLLPMPSKITHSNTDLSPMSSLTGCVYLRAANTLPAPHTPANSTDCSCAGTKSPAAQVQPVQSVLAVSICPRRLHTRCQSPTFSVIGAMVSNDKVSWLDCTSRRVLYAWPAIGPAHG